MKRNSDTGFNVFYWGMMLLVVAPTALLLFCVLLLLLVQLPVWDRIPINVPDNCTKTLPCKVRGYWEKKVDFSVATEEGREVRFSIPWPQDSEHNVIFRCVVFDDDRTRFAVSYLFGDLNTLAIDAYSLDQKTGAIKPINTGRWIGVLLKEEANNPKSQMHNDAKDVISRIGGYYYSDLLKE